MSVVLMSTQCLDWRYNNRYNNMWMLGGPSKYLFLNGPINLLAGLFKVILPQ